MPNSTEKEISTALKTKIVFFFKLQDVFIMLINVKMLTIVGILTFICMIHIMLSKGEHKKVA